MLLNVYETVFTGQSDPNVDTETSGYWTRPFDLSAHLSALPKQGKGLK